MEYNIWTELQDKDIESCKKFNNNLKSKNYGVCMFNIKLSGNVGMAVRSACVLGFNNFIICGRHHYDKRFTVGANNYIDISFWDEPVKVSIQTISNNKYSEDFIKILSNYFLYIFRVLLPNGDLYLTGNEEYFSPSLPNEFKQISACFSLQRRN